MLLSFAAVYFSGDSGATKDSVIVPETSSFRLTYVIFSSRFKTNLQAQNIVTWGQNKSNFYNFFRNSGPGVFGIIPIGVRDFSSQFWEDKPQPKVQQTKNVIQANSAKLVQNLNG